MAVPRILRHMSSCPHTVSHSSVTGMTSLSGGVSSDSRRSARDELRDKNFLKGAH